MAHRNGTYIAFHANGKRQPTESDIKYYNLLRAWRVRSDENFTFIDSHTKTGAIQDSSKHDTVARSLRARINNSKNMILIIVETTREDDDWVPMEIRHAIDRCALPIIAAYPRYKRITAPARLASLWPEALAERIAHRSARVIHIPSRKEPLALAVGRYGPSHRPQGALSYFPLDAYRRWGYA